MNTYADKAQENKSQSVVNEARQKRSDSESIFQFVDTRFEAIQMRKLQKMANDSPQAKRLSILHEIVNNNTIQRQLVSVGNGFFALDEEADSLVNDGTEKYRRLGQHGNVNLLEDDWGEVSLYDSGETKKYEGPDLKTKAASMLFRPAGNFSLLGIAPPVPLMNLMQNLIAHEPSAGKGEVARHLQILQPGLIPHSPKNYPSGIVTVPQANIAIGALPGSGYTFINGAGKLSVSFNGTELGFITIERNQGEALDVDVLEVHERYRGMNISRILMVMLANAAVATGVAAYRVGVKSDITNLPFWAQYSSNAASLLARGDHQNIEVPANPLA